MRGAGAHRDRAFARAGLLLLLALSAPALAWAHARTISYSQWRETAAGWDVQVRLPVPELDRRFGKGRWGTEAAWSFALTHFHAGDPGGDCTRTRGSAVLGEEEFVARWTETCRGTVRALSLDAFFDTAPSHLHHARVLRDGQWIERVVTAAAPRLLLEPGEARVPASAPVTGMLRVASAPSSWLFLAALVLLADSRRSLARLAAALALSGAAACFLARQGLLHADTRTLETLIALSVLWPAGERLLRGLPRRQALGGRLALCGALLILGLLAVRGALAVPPLCFLGLALVGLGLGAVPGPRGGACIPWILAAVLGPLQGMRAAGAPDPLSSTTAAQASPLWTLGLVLGMVAAEAVAAACMWMIVSRVSGGQRGASPGRAPLVERVAASGLLAAGTYGFLTHALGAP